MRQVFRLSSRPRSVYGAGGLPASVVPSAQAGAGAQYATADHLASPRVVTNSGGGVVSRRDYKPFGEEVAAGVGGRTAAQGYSQPDGVRQHYTGFERDDEAGLDFAEARYYSPGQGRFTSTDPIIMSMELAIDPQQVNLYAYVRNNPLRYVDPTGEIINEPANLSKRDQQRYDDWKRAYLATEEGRKTWDRYSNDQNFTLDITVTDRGKRRQE